MIRQFIWVSILLLLCCASGFAQEGIRATTEDGRTVILKPDGTWQYIEYVKVAKADESHIFTKPKASADVFKTKGERFEVWYSSKKWKQKPSEDPSKTTFEHSDGDVYALVVAERIATNVKALRQIALDNAKLVAPDIKIVFEENRFVNGKDILCLKLDGTIQGMSIRYYGYYYAGKAGMIQVVTFTAQNLFPEYESQLTDLLNGLVINEPKEE
jgi:hypothetical protein